MPEKPIQQPQPSPPQPPPPPSPPSPPIQPERIHKRDFPSPEFLPEHVEPDKPWDR